MIYLAGNKFEVFIKGFIQAALWQQAVCWHRTPI
jgi:hypothetical protein